MISLIAATLFFCEASPAEKSIWYYLRQYPQVQIVYPAELGALWTNRVACYNCSYVESLDLLLAGTGLISEWIERDAATVTVDPEFCRPELGALAPLPPCRPRPPGTMVVYNLDHPSTVGKD